MRTWIHSCLQTENWCRRTLCLVGILALIAIALVGRLMLAGASDPVQLVVYGFTTQEEAFTQSIFPAFEQAWEAKTGQKLTIESLFGPSGTMAGQINLGAPADIALLSNVQHVKWLQVGRRVKADTEPVTIGCTPIVIVTRPGNPAHIAGFADLALPGLTLIHANPRSSGAAEWAVLAEYGSALFESGEPAIAQAQLEAIWQNVRALTPSARSALTLFELGTGDAFVTYEQDALLARDLGIPMEIVIPQSTILAQHVAVIVDDNVTASERPVAEAFLDFLNGPGRQILAAHHLRPACVTEDQFPQEVRLFTVEDLGGWSRAYLEIVDTLWRSQVEPRLDLEEDPSLLDSGEG
jgi:ABC-type sulfate transport system substrate-binding protein